MIARIWHGWTTPQNANAYEQLLRHEIFVSISNKDIKGYKGIELLKRITTNEAGSLPSCTLKILMQLNNLQKKIMRLLLFLKKHRDYFCDTTRYRRSMKF